MPTSVLTNLLNYLYETLSPNNMRWIGERLIERANEKEQNIRPYTMKEVDEILAASEEDFRSGNIVTNDEVREYHKRVLSE